MPCPRPPVPMPSLTLHAPFRNPRTGTTQHPPLTFCRQTSHSNNGGKYKNLKNKNKKHRESPPAVSRAADTFGTAHERVSPGPSRPRGRRPLRPRLPGREGGRRAAGRWGPWSPLRLRPALPPRSPRPLRQRGAAQGSRYLRAAEPPRPARPAAASSARRKPRSRGGAASRRQKAPEPRRQRHDLAARLTPHRSGRGWAGRGWAGRGGRSARPIRGERARPLPPQSLFRRTVPVGGAYAEWVGLRAPSTPAPRGLGPREGPSGLFLVPAPRLRGGCGWFVFCHKATSPGQKKDPLGSIDGPETLRVRGQKCSVPCSEASADCPRALAEPHTGGAAGRAARGEGSGARAHAAGQALGEGPVAMPRPSRASGGRPGGEASGPQVHARVCCGVSGVTPRASPEVLGTACCAPEWESSGGGNEKRSAVLPTSPLQCVRT